MRSPGQLVLADVSPTTGLADQGPSKILRVVGEQWFDDLRQSTIISDRMSPMPASNHEEFCPQSSIREVEFDRWPPYEGTGLCLSAPICKPCSFNPLLELTSRVGRLYQRCASGLEPAG
jgi:hypothetical protein